jgi:hypothetical protein
MDSPGCLGEVAAGLNFERELVVEPVVLFKEGEEVLLNDVH